MRQHQCVDPYSSFCVQFRSHTCTQPEERHRKRLPITCSCLHEHVHWCSTNRVPAEDDVQSNLTTPPDASTCIVLPRAIAAIAGPTSILGSRSPRGEIKTSTARANGSGCSARASGRARHQEYAASHVAACPATVRATVSARPRSSRPTVFKVVRIFFFLGSKSLPGGGKYQGVLGGGMW